MTVLGALIFFAIVFAALAIENGLLSIGKAIKLYADTIREQKR